MKTENEHDPKRDAEVDKTCRRSKRSVKARQQRGSRPSACAQRSWSWSWAARRLRIRSMRVLLQSEKYRSLPAWALNEYWTLGLYRRDLPPKSVISARDTSQSNKSS